MKRKNLLNNQNVEVGNGGIKYNEVCLYHSTCSGHNMCYAAKKKNNYRYGSTKEKIMIKVKILKRSIINKGSNLSKKLS